MTGLVGRSQHRKELPTLAGGPNPNPLRPEVILATGLCGDSTASVHDTMDRCARMRPHSSIIDA